MMFPNESLEEDDLVLDKKTSLGRDFSKSQEASGKLNQQNEEDKLMRSVLENDKDSIEKGELLTESINNGVGSFNPDVLFDKLVKDYKQAKKIVGESFIRALTGYDPSYVEKNVMIPEFRRELQKRIDKKVNELKKKKLVDKDGGVTEKGYFLASLVMYTQELDNLKTSGLLGERPQKKRSFYGEKSDIKSYAKSDRYKDIDVKKSAKTAIRRNHKEIMVDDLKVFTRDSKARIQVVYCVDASGSMKGEKIGVSKKAGIALAYKALERKDKVGVVVFGREVKEFVRPTDDFLMILRTLSKVSASSETDIAKTIKTASELFVEGEGNKHLILISDALPTVGEDPEKEVLFEVANAAAQDVTVSIVGINLDEEGENLAKKITDVGGGRFYLVNDLSNMDKIVLEDYYSYY
ncbi:VWA domain-containing protein [Candidatus Woesearchaeota archaeon]|nr:VWA domain-containing protein [Candidatus Woesearchaeota archaeon]